MAPEIMEQNVEAKKLQSKHNTKIVAKSLPQNFGLEWEEGGWVGYCVGVEATTKAVLTGIPPTTI